MDSKDQRFLGSLVRAAAQQELLPRFADVACETKADNSVVTEADLRMQSRLQSELNQHWPEFALLGEEMSAAQQHELMQAPGKGLWILDPLDGTNNFAAGIPYFSVSLALMVDGRIELGLVYDPVRDECFSAVAGKGATLNDQPLKACGRIPPLGQTMAVIDFKRLPAALAARLACDPPYGSQRSFGSVALDWAWLSVNRFHLYLHGKQKLWDYAAGFRILAEAGGNAQTLESEPVFAASMTPRSTLAALDTSLFAQWAAWVGDS